MLIRSHRHGGNSVIPAAMPSAAPLSALTDRMPHLLSQIIDPLAADGAMAWWFDDHAVVHVPGPVHRVYALGNGQLDPSVASLAAVREDLPARLHLFAGHGLGGVLCKTHHVELVGPYQRFVSTTSTPAAGALTTITATDGRALTHLGSRAPTPWGTGAGLALVEAGRVVAAAELLVDDIGRDMARVGPVRVARDDDAARHAVRFLRLAANHRKLVAHDVRLDRRDRYGWAVQAGLSADHLYEHWRCEAHDRRTAQAPRSNRR